MSQQLVKKGTNGKHENVMPKSWIEAIKDKNTGKTLVEILQSFNMYFLPYDGNSTSTRCLVPTMLRKKGLWITYVKYDGNVYTEWYAASEIDDTSWGDSSNWRVGNNTLVGDITISANGNWVINGTETKFKAVGEKGNTPSIRVANNRLQVSYNLGGTYMNVTENPVYTQFRNHNNKIQISTDLGATWTDTSDEIAAYFRWYATTEDTQANNVGRIQISRDTKTWTNLSNDIVNNLHISRYIGANESLPTSSIAEGTIYAKGPYYDEGDTLNNNPIYRLWVYAWKGNTLAWQDNGEFQSIAAGVVQETGDSETEVMSQKAVTDEFIKLGAKVGIVGEYTSTPARTDLSIDGVDTYKGYKISLEGLYEQGIRSIYFKGNDYSHTSTVTAGLIVNKSGAVESYIPYDGYNAPKMYNLPITEKSDYFWGTYNYSGEHQWLPTNVFFIDALNKKFFVDVENIESRLVYIQSFEGNDIYTINNALEGSQIITDCDIVVTGRNILNASTIKKNIIINDSGVEISDVVSSYYDYYIPVIPGQTIIASFPIEKFYKYSKTKGFIGRTSNYIPENTPFSIPSGTYWIKIQVSLYGYPEMVVYGNVIGDYEDFKENQNKTAYSLMNVYSVNREQFSMDITKEFNASEYAKKSIKLQNRISNIEDDLEYNDYEIEEKGSIISIPKAIYKRVKSLRVSSNAIIIGQNIFDDSTLKRNYIINDSGEDVYDGVSSYYTQFILCEGKSIIPNFPVQRLYLYNKDKQFLYRTDGISAGNVYIIPSHTYYIRVQVTDEYLNSYPNKMIVFDGVGDINTFMRYKTFDELPNQPFNILSNDSNSVSATLTINAKYVFPEVGTYGYWEPEDVTDDYSCPIGQGTQSVEGLTYELLLTNYFDIYINKKYSDGYTVTKKGLGNDSANNNTYPLGNEVFMYDFKPKYFNHTVLISAGMNACELSGIFGIAYFIKALMEHTEEGMKALYNTTRFVVMPCMCPSCLNSSPIKYTNFNGVRINKNFNYKGSWKNIKEMYPYEPVGAYPDSEVETVMLKKWINDYSNADLWIDCHSDAGSAGYTNLMTQVICSDYSTVAKVQLYWGAMKQFYIDKGYITEQTEVSQQAWVENGFAYPKTLYGKQVCGTPSIMIEQYISSKTFGSDGKTNNDSYGIKNYVSLLRAYVLSSCRSVMQILK